MGNNSYREEPVEEEKVKIQLRRHVRDRSSLITDWWIFFSNVPLLVFCCHVGIYHAFSDLEQHAFITPHFR